MLKHLSGLFGREQKQSATGTLTAINLVGKPVWTPRNYTALATEGFAKNAIAYRCIRMISEACASIPLRVEFEGRRAADHPLQKLIDRPNPEQGGADLREALYGGLQTAGNAYIEAVALDDAPFELWSLRPDRMKVIPNRQGLSEGYEYATSAGKTVIGRDDDGWLKVLHLKLWHPLDDWYYANESDRVAQTRTPISNGAYGEPWVFRPKALATWWSSAHHDRPNGVRSAVATVRGEAAGASQVTLDVPLVLSAAQATDYAAYALRAAQTVRHSLTLDVDPLRLLELETGDGLTFEGDGRAYRLALVDQGETPTVTLEPVPEVRVFTGADPSQAGSQNAVVRQTIITGFRLLELPCFGIDEQNIRPILVPSADIWAGVDVYAGAGAESLRRRGRVEQAAAIGRTLNALPVQRGHYLLRGASFDIYLEGEALVSRTEADLLGGENVICVRALNGEWEMIQYLTVTALAVDRYRLSGLVRGQWGTEQARLAGMAAGAEVIILPAEFVRADMATDEIGLKPVADGADRLWRHCGKCSGCDRGLDGACLKAARAGVWAGDGRGRSDDKLAAFAALWRR